MSTNDLGALLTQVKSLETDRERLSKELMEAQKRYEEERRRLEETQQKMGRLTEGKRNEMQQALDTVIKKWLEDSVKDENLRKQFETGMTRLVENTEEDSGVWQVVCCASNVHLRRLQELEQVKGEFEAFKSKAGPEFNAEDSRKRARDEPVEENKNIWAIFEENMKGRDYTAAL